MYDAVATAPANYFLLKRSITVNDTTVTTTTNDTSTTPTTFSAANDTTTAAALAAAAAGRLLPGDAGRWALPADVSGLQQLSYMYEQMDVMYDTWVLYGVLQGVVLVLLLLRLVHHLSFQPRCACGVSRGRVCVCAHVVCHGCVCVCVCVCVCHGSVCVMGGCVCVSWEGVCVYVCVCVMGGCVCVCLCLC